MTNNKIVYQVDSFTSEVFKGNPAGVVFAENNTDPKWMQQLAMEMNLSETAFVMSNGESYDIRFFTPTNEIDLCGHATLASAHLMYELGIAATQEQIQFNAKGGELQVTKEADGIKMRFPKYAIEQVAVPENFNALVGFEPVEFFNSGDWTVAVAKSQNDIEIAGPIFDKLPVNGLGHLLITAESNIPDIDFVVRCFAPQSGINEDPVTGSAQCALVPIWHIKTGRKVFNALQLSQRTGHLKVGLIDDIVEIKGNAVTVFKATLK
ncbi:PhzF family phenazine biosynthesis protein [Aquimarina agarivorans]|uniref:PhzF family phenazine biosynthesis protein n=1 Tax=Aquimarina agarivorans TaxID=980584 RepID=UPI000248E5FB|nr:PhzF family phenazine biosynthesis protein [Aquimarina agarivorans]